MNFEDRKFDIEHALAMHAYSHVIAPAEAIYQPDLLEQYAEIIRSCHIYLIGTMPQIELEDWNLEGDVLAINVKVGGNASKARMAVPAGTKLHESDEGYYIELPDGSKGGPSDETILRALHRQRELVFEVLYVGQAYGRDGSRHALDRLLKHETLQKISVQGIPSNKRLQLLLLQIQPNNSIITFINPKAKDSSNSHKRIEDGIQKLRNTNEHERITLFEASLIRYFRPRFNIEFKDSFPSTNLKVLRDCYDKDFSAVIADIAISDLHVLIGSDAVEPKQAHSITTNLHDDADRRFFFSVSEDAPQDKFD